MDLSVIIPVYNGSAFLRERLPLISRYLERQRLDYELIAVDDGSDDGSGDLVQALDLPHCRVVTAPQNEGKYAAIARGVSEATGRCILFTDADIPYDPNVIAHMADLVLNQGFHLAVGDRSLEESSAPEPFARLRRAASRCFSFFIRVFVTGGLHDSQCGVKALRGDAARLVFPMLCEAGFTGAVELLYVALKYNCAVRRVPVHLVYHGDSKVRVFRHGVDMIMSSLRLRRRFRRGHYQSPELLALVRQDYPRQAH